LSARRTPVLLYRLRVATYVVSGSASGMGAATAELLRAGGHRVIGIDLHDADVVADLSSSDGRATAVDAVTAACDGPLDGAALFAGVGGATGRPASLLVSLNYFGSVELFAAFRPLLAAGDRPSSAVAISSNSSTCQPGWSEELVAACLAGDEEQARLVADRGDSATAYPATKAALARWVRRTAPGPEWAGAGVRLNAVAPGLVETAFVEETRNDPVLGPLIGGFPLPLGRGGRAEEIAALVVFLLGEDAGFFCGSVILCDGGTEALLRPDDWPARWELRR
jgi:NAD(P)-dependent dehydrogenase (short-subunit alcohol dehydrogenase family)